MIGKQTTKSAVLGFALASTTTTVALAQTTAKEPDALAAEPAASEEIAAVEETTSVDESHADTGGASTSEEIAAVEETAGVDEAAIDGTETAVTREGSSAWPGSTPPEPEESESKEPEPSAADHSNADSPPDVGSDADDESWENAREVIRRGLRLDLDESKTSYFKMMFTTQLWGRVVETNPGTARVVTEEPLGVYSDFALRRARWMAYANIANRVLFFSQIGITSFANYSENRNPFYVHDIQGQVRYAGDHYLGGGLHFFQGLSRLARVGHTNYLTLDNEGFNFPNVFVDDWVVRQIGPFIRGMQGRLGYHVSTNVPAQAPSSTGLLSDQAIEDAAVDDVAVLRRHGNFNVRGYLYWSFLTKEKESASGRFSMSHHGKKGPIFNLGAGWQYQPGGVGWWDEEAGEVKTQGSLALAGDAFWEQPLFDESVLNLYGAYHYYDFGPNYTKTSAVMGGFAVVDPNAADEVLLPGPGLVQYSFGSGHLAHVEAGYILPHALFPVASRLQPYAALTMRDMEAFDEPSWTYHFGMNWLLMGHNLKATAEYMNRALYNPVSRTVLANPGMFVLQLQLRL